MNLVKLVQGGQGEADEATMDADGVGPANVNAKEFKQLVAESELPVVVDFWAEWCGPCHMLAPSVAQLARDFAGRAVVAKLNADEYPEILDHYGIRGIPTLIYFKDGREADRVIGVNPYGTLKNKLEKLAHA
jgi:thioredoxin 1